MTDQLLNAIRAKFPLHEIDAGSFSKLKAKGMKFDVHAYEAKGLGHVSVMRASGMLGMMKMDTLIIELYDTTVEPLKYDALEAVNAANRSLPERDPGTHWYDSIKLKESVSKKGKKLTAQFDAYTKAYTDAYLNLPAKPVTDPKTKREKTDAYVEGLLKNGGPSTDVFKQALGETRTRELFSRVLFGTSR